ncbi:hypothetical protein TUM20903_11500 [Citrobacter koseri]|nr:hypothetical protein TUM13189_11200 [Citrobacter koseri]BDG88412.1 hypothetical protein TUM20903_11500 [Citrobacter koseri]
MTGILMNGNRIPAPEPAVTVQKENGILLMPGKIHLLSPEQKTVFGNAISDRQHREQAAFAGFYAASFT